MRSSKENLVHGRPFAWLPRRLLPSCMPSAGAHLQSNGSSQANVPVQRTQGVQGLQGSDHGLQAYVQSSCRSGVQATGTSRAAARKKPHSLAAVHGATPGHGTEMMRTSAGGGASHSKVMTLSMPSDLSCSTVPDKSLRCISGTARCTQVGRQGGERAGWLSGKQAPQAGGE